MEIAPGVVVVALSLALLLWLRPRLRAWRRATARRQELGDPTDELEDDRVATVVGELGLDGSPCERFEDGASVAVSMLEDRGAVSCLALQADGALFIRRAHDVIVLDGPVRVLVGTMEAHPLTGLDGLTQSVRTRLSEHAPDGFAGDVVFRSLSVGDQVVVRGVVQRIPKASAGAYRSEAAFRMKPEDEHVLAGGVRRPRVRGALLCALLGIRGRAELIAVTVALLLIGAALRTDGPFTTTSVSVSRPDPSPTRLPISRAACDDIAKDYAGQRYNASWCTDHAMCRVEARGGRWFSLDGCHRFIGQQNTRTIDVLAERWLDGGCAHEFETCEPPPRAQCVAGRCVELPPDPIPAEWRRAETLGTFWFYLPPEVRENEAEIEDSYVREWTSANMRLALDYGTYNGAFDPPGGGGGGGSDPNTITEDVVIHSVRARYRRLDNQDGEHPVSVAVRFAEPPPCSTVECQVRIQKPATLAIYAFCRDHVTCDVAERILRSTRFRRKLAE